MTGPQVSRRVWFAGVVSGASVFAAACSGSGNAVLDTPEGRVLQYEGDDMLVLVSGLQPSYRLGDTMHLNVILNNQADKPIQARVRVKLLGRGDQPVVQPEPLLLDIRSDDAANVDQTIPLGLDLAPGD